MKADKKTLAILAVAWSSTAAADWTDARCDIYPRGEDTASAVISCTFAQRQGAVTIVREDGVKHDLVPVGDMSGNFIDQHGREAYRQGDLGDQGLIFRFPDESVYVYWNTAALEPGPTDSPTWPFTTRDYDATTVLRCRAAGAEEFGGCPAGILRMEVKQASVVLQNQAGEQFTINFMTDYVNATNRAVDARLVGDTWIVTIDGGEVVEVPLAAIEGG